MLHQSKIRKTALCLVYAVLEHHSSEADFPFEAYWELALEKDMDHYRQALAKAALHICRAAAELAAPVTERGEALLQDARQDGSLFVLLDPTELCVERTKAALVSVTELRRCLHDKRRHGSTPLEEASLKLIRQAGALRDIANALLRRIEDMPVIPPSAESFAGALRRWARILAECAELADPLSLSEPQEYAGLVHKARDLQELRPAAEQLAREVISRRDEWEATLHRLLRNYVPERLDTVDKAILYLSLYELNYRKLDAPIVISEAINLAHEFSGSKSAPFVHGILATAIHETSEQS